MFKKLALLIPVLLLGYAALHGDSYSSGPGIRVVTKVDTTGLTANVASAALYAVPSGSVGLYMYCANLSETTAATTSSTLPNAFLSYTDNDSNATTPNALVSSSSGNNTVGTVNGIGSSVTNCYMLRPKPGTTINYGTSNYASNSAAQMTYAIHSRLFFLGL